MVFFVLLFERSLGRRGRFCKPALPFISKNKSSFPNFGEIFSPRSIFLRSPLAELCSLEKEAYRIANIFQTKLICPYFTSDSLSIFFPPSETKLSFSLRFLAFNWDAAHDRQRRCASSAQRSQEGSSCAGQSKRRYYPLREESKHCRWILAWRLGLREVS